MSSPVRNLVSPSTGTRHSRHNSQKQQQLQQQQHCLCAIASLPSRIINLPQIPQPPWNLQVVRTCASAGRLEQALQLLEAMSDNAMRSAMSDDEGSADEIEALTFSTVASECIKAGWSSKAEEVLDMRDYL